MPCPELLRTQAFIDGAVGDAEAEAAERHIAQCPECQSFCADAASLSDAIRRSASQHAAPAGLRARVRRRLAGADGAVRRSFWRGAFGGAGVTGVAAALAFLFVQPPSAAGLADQLARAHVRALMDGRTIAVASGDHHTLKPWFAGRIDISPPVRDFTAQGYTLIGGRLDRVGRAPAAVLVYRHGRHELDLFVWAERGGRLPAQAVRRGYHLMVWKAGDLAFAVVSDTAAPELAQFVRLVRAEPE